MNNIRRFISRTKQNYTKQNYIEQVVQNYAVNTPRGHLIRSGDIVTIQPEHILTHDNSFAVISKTQPVIALDHDVQNTSQTTLDKYQAIQSFARQHNISFFPAGRGIGHQIMLEEGFATPYSLTVASDSHANMYGGIGAVGTPLVRTDAAAMWATGTAWWQVPPVVRVELHGQLRPNVYGKDVIVTLCGLFSNDEVLNTAVLFCGPGAQTLAVHERLAIANMTTEWGALAGVFPPDDHTFKWLKNQKVSEDKWEKIKEMRENVECDPDGAGYAAKIELDLGSVVPAISGPDTVKRFQPVSQLVGTKINKAYLVSCVNSRAEDLHEAAKVLKGKKVHEDVEFYVAAASSLVQEAAESNGDWGILLSAGAKPLPAGCGPCVGLGAGLLKEGEVGISATNRNYKGRMGSPKAHTYLSSPAVVAASAVAGCISLPVPIDSSEINNLYKYEKCPEVAKEEPLIQHIEGFPKEIAGELIFCPADNLNTDGIYAGKYTYRDDMTPELMRRVVMENYDTQFSSAVKPGHILAAGYNFGTGSSREQAATALLAAGVTCVVAGSFSTTFLRNAINNGLICVESPLLVESLRKTSSGSKTQLTGWQAQIYASEGKIRANSAEYACSRIGPAAQQVIASGGLERWVQTQLL